MCPSMWHKHWVIFGSLGGFSCTLATSTRLRSSSFASSIESADAESRGASPLLRAHTVKEGG